MQPEQGGAQPLFGSGLAQLGALAQLGQDRPYFAFAKAQLAQAGEDLGLHCQHARL